jgi:hypothetical protein
MNVSSPQTPPQTPYRYANIIAQKRVTVVAVPKSTPRNYEN